MCVKSWKHTLAAAVMILLVSEVINTLSAFLTMGYYMDPNYFAVWSKIMMPGPGPPPAEFTYYGIAFAFIYGLIFSYVYMKVSGILKGKNWMQKGLRYGFGVFLIAGVPMFLNMYLLINLPLGLLVEWAIVDGLIAYLLTGIAVAKIME